MRPLLSLREGIKSAGARRRQYVLVTLMVGALLAAIGSAEVLSTAAAITKMDAEVEKGATVVVLDRNEGELSGAQCLQLAGLRGVVEVGAVGKAQVTGFAEYPSVPFQRADITPGLVEILYPGMQLRPGIGGLAGEGLGEEVGVVDGSMATFADNTKISLGVAAYGTARSADRSRWVYILNPAPAHAAECWVEAAVGSTEAVREVAIARFKDVKDLRVRSLTHPAAYESTRDSWLERPTQFGWLAGTVIGGGLALILVYQRRHELALYRLLGVGKAHTAVVGAVSTLVVLLSAVLFAVEVSLLVALLNPGVDGAAAQAGITQVVLSGSGSYFIAIAGACAAATGNTTRMIRGRS